MFFAIDERVAQQGPSKQNPRGQIIDHILREEFSQADDDLRTLIAKANPQLLPDHAINSYRDISRAVEKAIEVACGGPAKKSQFETRYAELSKEGAIAAATAGNKKGAGR